MSEQLNADQASIYLRLMAVLDTRHDRMQAELTDALNQLKFMLDEADAAGDPRAEVFDRIVHTLVITAIDGKALHNEVSEVLFGRMIQAQSARNAYDQGWRDRLIDLLTRATPEQVAILRAIVVEEQSD